MESIDNAAQVDLALLTVKKAAFWQGAMQLNLGPSPRLQQEVHVIGYPLGGDGISITAGVVSRVDFGEYVAFGRSRPMFNRFFRYAQSKKSNLSVQVDAAINSGNRCCLCTMIFACRATAVSVTRNPVITVCGDG